jgi:hypothetical protein
MTAYAFDQGYIVTVTKLKFGTVYMWYRFFTRGYKLFHFISELRLLVLSCNCGGSIFIDYCTAPATQRKMEGGERDIQLMNVNEASSCLAQGYCVPYSPIKESGAYQAPPSPPPPTHSPCRILTISGDLGQKSRGQPPFRSLKVLQLNLDSNCGYVRIFGAVIGHLEAKIDF